MRINLPNLNYSLLKANRHLDEESAKILIERALIENEEGELGFSRDINVKVTVSWFFTTNDTI